jgi:hypothetical protein
MSQNCFLVEPDFSARAFQAIKKNSTMLDSITTPMPPQFGMMRQIVPE